jgi:DHA2 family methylenomycin A resistance protein-like MFS transporter
MLPMSVAVGAGSLASGRLTARFGPRPPMIAAGRQHAGVASGVLNTARQAGGALGVALLGSLLAESGAGLALSVPLGVAAAGLLAAVGLAWMATSPAS